MQLTQPAVAPRIQNPAPVGGRVPALDGYRGIGVAAVVLFHADVVRGGWLGVDLFFVLSGFLITRLLVAEQASSGRIDMVHFWKRRGRRLLPALVAFFAGVAVFAWWYPEPRLLPADLPAQMMAALFYVANWFQLATTAGYWAQYSVPSPLSHMWSLSIEEQFYLLFPLLMAGVFAVVRRRGRIALVLGGLTLVSWTLGVAYLALGWGFERVYLGTDTRVGAVFCGATAGYLSCRPESRAGLLRIARVLSVPALVVVVGAVVALDAGTGWSALQWLWMPGFELAVTCLLLAALVSPAEAPPVTNRIVTVRPLLWLGAISYGLYLWHLPVLLTVQRLLRTSPRWVVVVVAIAASLAVAQLSYRIVEQPIRRHGLSIAPRFTLAGAAILVLAGSFVSLQRSAQPARDEARQRERTVTSRIVEVAPEATTTSAIAPAESVTSAPTTTIPHATVPIALPEGRANRVLMVGDSVAMSLAPKLTQELERQGMVVSSSTGVGCPVGGSGPPGPDDNEEIRSSRLRCAELIDSFPSLVQRTQPDLVLMVRTYAREAGPDTGGSTDQCDAAYQEWYIGALRQEIQVLGAGGATVAVTPPLYNRIGLYSGAEQAHIDDQADCVARATGVAVAAEPHAVLLPVDRWVCPTRECVTQVDGTTLRPDGLHFDKGGATLATRWMADYLYGPGR